MKIDPTVLTVLRAAEVEGDALTLAGQLDRPLYVKTNKVLEALGGKWNKKQKCHLFEGAAEERLEQVLETGEYTDARRELGFFETPPAVADYAASLLALDECRNRDRIMEPSAGRGALIQAALRVKNAPFLEFTAIEINPEHEQALRHVAERVIIHDFLDLASAGNDYFQRVLMNPPFGKQADIRHVLHAWEFLEPGGRLVSIMSPSFTFRTNTLSREFKQFVDDHGEWEPLPEKCFKPSGTDVRTVVITLDK